MKYLIKLRIIGMESKIVLRLYQFFYDACDKLSRKHSEIADKGYKLIAEHRRGEEDGIHEA